MYILSGQWNANLDRHHKKRNQFFSDLLRGRAERNGKISIQILSVVLVFVFSKSVEIKWSSNKLKNKYQRRITRELVMNREIVNLALRIFIDQMVL